VPLPRCPSRYAYLHRYASVPKEAFRIKLKSPWLAQDGYRDQTGIISRALLIGPCPVVNLMANLSRREGAMAQKRSEKPKKMKISPKQEEFYKRLKARKSGKGA
jgi:hypothetical protein